MANELHDNVSRVKKANYLGTSIFVGLRAADAFWQYALLSRSWAAQLVWGLGGQALPSAGLASPYHEIITCMAFGSSLKQIVTQLVVSEQEMNPSSAITIALFNTAFNTLNSILSVWAVTSFAPPSGRLLETLQTPMIALAVGAYSVGIFIEQISELQRTWSKRNPANKGKPYADGLFSLARHINYGGYTIWRAAYAPISGGYTWGLLVFTFFFSDFTRRGVPVLDNYLSETYGEEWNIIKLQVPYRLIPGVY
ncbi:hypothetical protein INS49_009441 [Diaporthe citri]|uniref:uncharacterized protein n=1 Tax=Diaporthe citri TaxID=83186 RepID=UPI001C817E76|nr:uncharacterized protein INS49_009441 [Diaporthe citri]KAG6361217.1 hypothetical protein INS49_009441 [Diaporthe citri]